jgi:two-component system, chemotaxis family, CheB/CheR fusion protein
MNKRRKPGGAATDVAAGNNEAKANGPRENDTHTEEENRHGDAPRLSGAREFRVVGVGASAGGLEALTQLFQHLPKDSGLAFILVQHLAPDHKSALAQLLERQTGMQVQEAVDGTPVNADCVYVIPPDRHLAIENGAIRLTPQTRTGGANMAIDFFFRSLAEDQGMHAIGIVLSGAGSDGMLGLKAIQEAGGITFVQDETSAKFTGMPHASIAAGCADFVLPPDKIASELVRISATMMVNRSAFAMAQKEHANDQDSLKRIFTLLVSQRGVDFMHYKHSTIQRRIERRMLLLRLGRMSDYVTHLEENPTEIDALYHDILINVTRFFRDQEAFDALKTIVFPIVMKNRQPGVPIRIWVPGCSSGEEVYSIAICLIEYLAETEATFPIQIFGSDVDEPAISQARAGIYPYAVSSDIPEERLSRYFTKLDSGFQIVKYVRERCVFAKQNLVKDPPFSNLDLISCRNLLIYLGPVLQKRAMAVFHYALRPNGLLLLGAAEGVGAFSDLFRMVDQKARVYAKEPGSAPLRLNFDGASPKSHPQNDHFTKNTGVAAGASVPLQQDVERQLLTRYAPPAVVINEQMQILYFRGDTSLYLQSAVGEATLNLLKMARGNLMLELRIAVSKAISTHGTVRRENVQFKENDRLLLLDIEVAPLLSAAGTPANFLVMFEPASVGDALARPTSRTENTGIDQQHVIDELTHELVATREYLQSAITQHDALSAELSAASEELQSSNEELQSINEELESAKEELQSTNEELATVNDELEHRNVQLTELNADLGNLVDSTGVATVMVDRELRIRRFTPQATSLLNLIPSDIGRPFSNIKINVPSAEFSDILEDVVSSADLKILEAQDDAGHWYSIRFYPYKATDGSTDGAIVAFIDIDQMKRSLDQAKNARDYAEAVIAAAPQPALILDKDLRVISASKAYLAFFRVSEKETVGNLLYHLGNGQWGIPKLRDALEESLVDGAGFNDYIVKHKFEHLGDTCVQVSGRHINAGSSRPSLVYMQIEHQAAAGKR